jgi:4-hydroxy-2-oxoheptanedioate aldolase
VAKPPIHNLLKAAIHRGERARGTFVKLPGLEVVDCVRLAGLDFAVVDLEHSALDERTVLDQVAYARALGLPCLVRLPEPDRGLVGRLLDAGAAGVQLSDVSRRAEVDALVAAATLPPAGERGVSTTNRAGGYGTLGVDDYVAAAPPDPLLVVQIERGETHDPLESILQPAVDVCFVGPVDMSVALGVPGQLDHPTLLDRRDEIARAAAERGIAFGEHRAAGSRAHPAARYVTIGTDVTTLLGGLRRLAEAVGG